MTPRFGRLITGHEVVTVVEAGWSGLTNGRLLAVAQHKFDCPPTDAESESRRIRQ